jgi:hypothetical protein
MRFANLCWPGSLRSRLLAVYGLSMVFSALLVGALVILVAKPFDSYALQRGMGHAAEKLAEWVRFDANGVPQGFSERELKAWMLTSLGEEMQLRITDAGGRVVFAPNGETQPLTQAGLGFDPQLKAFAFERGGVVMRAGTATLVHDGTTWHVQVAVSDRMVDWLRESVGLPALWRGMVAIGVVFLVVFLFSTHRTLQRMLRPLGVAAQDAQRITPQTLGRACSPRTCRASSRPWSRPSTMCWTGCTPASGTSRNSCPWPRMN